MPNNKRIKVLRDAFMSPELRQQMSKEIASQAAIRAHTVGMSRRLTKAKIKEARNFGNNEANAAWETFNTERDAIVAKYNKLNRELLDQVVLNA